MMASRTPQLDQSRTLKYFRPALIIGCHSVLDKLQHLISPRVSHIVGSWSATSAAFSRFGLQAIVSFSYSIFENSYKQWAVVNVLPLFHLFFLNPHLPLPYNTAILNATLQAEGYSLVARQESLTGYISVLDNVKDGFRAMRCDHSLLGGEWTNKPEGHPSVLDEPIYAIFVMLEAVRLVEGGQPNVMPDLDKEALVM